MFFNWKRYIVGLLLFAILLLFFGCGGGSSQSTNTISGRTILNGAGEITVTIAGAGSGSKTTIDGGNYSFTGLPNGDYTITPSLSGYTFFPLSQNITVANGNVTVPGFTATATSSPGFTVSGKVSLNSAGLAGVAVTITGAGSGNTATDNNGFYFFNGVRNGNCTITPSILGYSFTPLSQAITVANGNVTVPEFTATATSTTTPTFTISGKVSLNGTGLAGVTVTIAGAGIGGIVTDDTGIYTFTGVLNGDYTITPALTGYTFPASSPFSVNNGNVTGQDFPATPTNTGSIHITF